MRDKRDAVDVRARDARDIGGFCLKSLLTLMTLLTLITANAQGLLPRRTLGAGSIRRPATAGNPATRNPQPASSSAASAADAGGRSIEFNAAPVDMVFTVYQDLVGKTVLKDPQTPQATITLQPQKGQELTDEDKIEAIETVLEMNGIHMEPYGEKFVRALPRKDVRKDGIPLIMDPEAKLGESTRVVSLMIPFENIAVEEAQKALEGFKSNSGILLVFERTNKILVTDTEQIINRMREIAREIDKASPVTEVVEYIQIKYANANEVKQVIDNIVQESMKEQEKNSKAPANRNVQPQGGLNRPLLGGLRRPGQPNQPAAPENNASLVMTVSDADRGMIRGKVVTIADERSNKILIITNASNMKFFKEVIAALDVETTPDVQVKVYRLKYAEAEDVSDMINDLIGNSASSKDNKGAQNPSARTGTSGSVTRGTTTQRKPANQRTGESKAGELNKDNVTVLADKRINGLVVMARTEDIPTIEQIIESMDIKLSQVLIETVIIEVGLGDGIETGIDWISRGKQGETTKSDVQATDAFGRNLYYTERTITREDGTTSSSILSNLIADGDRKTGTLSDGSTYVDTPSAYGFFETISKTLRDGAAGFKNSYSGGAYSMGGGAMGGVSGMSAMDAMGALSGMATNVFGKSGMNLIWQSDKLNLGAIINATKTDSRTKYIASPIIMTLDNKEAEIEATDMVYLFKGYQYSGSSQWGSPVKDYEQKELGITIKVTPKINPNGTVMLTVEEEYSQQGADQTVDGVPQATTVTRKMSADALLENNQTAIFAGLTTTRTSESESGIPLLKDIPIIGKWLFGSVSRAEKRTELMVFMTPYVLDDAQAAQAEALRRKKTLSDPRPWDDHGWSLSPIADPVSKQEQMRRIKDQWRIQDEERRTKIAIEKAKVDRVKKLEKMSKEERELWLKIHKEELDEEKQDELEEKMLDEKSQEELKKLAAEIRAKKLGEAEKELKAAEEEAAAENERGKLDAAKKRDGAEGETK